METHTEIMTDSKVNQNSNLNVNASEESTGFFIIHPVGTINTNTYPILQKEMELIFESRPEIIIFDMKQANYVNFRGLRVLLKAIIEMNQRNGKVCLKNLQPQVKEMFESMIEALPDWICRGSEQLKNNLDANHNNCSGDSQWTKSDD